MLGVSFPDPAPSTVVACRKTVLPLLRALQRLQATRTDTDWQYVAKYQHGRKTIAALSSEHPSRRNAHERFCI